jgi:uncharacterized repeat protein (TIGR02543 family)
LASDYPRVSGYYFCGWAYKNNADSYEVRPGGSITVTGAVTLYPVYVTKEKATSGEEVYIYDISEFSTEDYDIERIAHTTEHKEDTSYWGNWSDYSTTAVTASSTVQVRTTTLYRYYYYLCPYCGAHEPFYGKSDCGQQIPSSAWHQTWSTTSYASSNYKKFSYTTAKYYTESLGDGQLWVFSSGNVNNTAVGTQDAAGSGDVIVTGYSSRKLVEQYNTSTETTYSYKITPKTKNYTITFDANGGTGAPAAQTRVAGETYTLPYAEPQRTGYTFVGWGTSSTGSVVYPVGSRLAVNGNMTLYAVWEKVIVTFSDVPTGIWYTDPVTWAATNGITDGTSDTTFSPMQSCTRAQVVTFLWRAAGSPKPSTTSSAFADVPTGTWYTDAVNWAVEQGITDGTSATTFSPMQYCTRAQVVTFLWRANGEPKVKTGTGTFSDVSAGQYYTDAVAWAIAEGITDGVGGGKFGTADICNRAQVVTFLYRNQAA